MDSHCSNREPAAATTAPVGGYYSLLWNLITHQKRATAQNAFLTEALDGIAYQGRIVTRRVTLDSVVEQVGIWLSHVPPQCRCLTDTCLVATAATWQISEKSWKL